jgi:formylglycine-generating enzyme required for sulfatase activity
MNRPRTSTRRRALRSAALALGGVGAALAVAAAPATWVEPVTGMRFVALNKGCFQMGTPAAVRPKADFIWEHLGYRGQLAQDEVPQHEACVEALWMAQHEVRADDWRRVMGRAPPSGRGDAPAAGITWDEAQAFARRLGELGGGKQRFRLPTEAEWEYACRAGDESHAPPEQQQRIEGAWYKAWTGTPDAPAPVPQPVAALKSNRLGLHDMLGNVWEWTDDGYRPDAYAHHGLYEPKTPAADGAPRVVRGASHRSEYLQVRCGTRSALAPSDRLPQVGLRLVRLPVAR